MLAKWGLSFAALAAACVVAGTSANATGLSGLKSAMSGQAASNVEQVARRCKVDRHGHVRCRKARHRAYRRYDYNPYADYDYGYGYSYPRYYGFGHHHHHGFGHHHHHHHHGHH